MWMVKSWVSYLVDVMKQESLHALPRSDQVQAPVGSDNGTSNPVQNTLAVRPLVGTVIFRMPEVKDLGCPVAVASHQSMMVQTQYQVGILMPPTVERLVKSVHSFKVSPPDSEIATANAFPGKSRLDASGHSRPSQKVCKLVDVALRPPDQPAPQ